MKHRKMMVHSEVPNLTIGRRTLISPNQPSRWNRRICALKKRFGYGCVHFEERRKGDIKNCWAHTETPGYIVRERLIRVVEKKQRLRDRYSRFWIISAWWWWFVHLHQTIVAFCRRISWNPLTSLVQSHWWRAWQVHEHQHRRRPVYRRLHHSLFRGHRQLPSWQFVQLIL